MRIVQLQDNMVNVFWSKPNDIWSYLKGWGLGWKQEQWMCNCVMNKGEDTFLDMSYRHVKYRCIAGIMTETAASKSLRRGGVGGVRTACLYRRVSIGLTLAYLLVDKIA